MHLNMYYPNQLSCWSPNTTHKTHRRERAVGACEIGNLICCCTYHKFMTRVLLRWTSPWYRGQRRRPCLEAALVRMPCSEGFQGELTLGVGLKETKRLFELNVWYCYMYRENKRVKSGCSYIEEVWLSKVEGTSGVEIMVENFKRASFVSLNAVSQLCNLLIQRSIHSPNAAIMAWNRHRLGNNNTQLTLTTEKF